MLKTKKKWFDKLDKNIIKNLVIPFFPLFKDQIICSVGFNNFTSLRTLLDKTCFYLSKIFFKKSDQVTWDTYLILSDILLSRLFAPPSKEKKKKVSLRHCRVSIKRASRMDCKCSEEARGRRTCPGRAGEAGADLSCLLRASPETSQSLVHQLTQLLFFTIY